MPYKETKMHGPNYSQPPPDLVDGEEEFKVEQILGMKQMGRVHKTHYLVKWKGYPTSDNSWEPEKNLNAEELITKFRRSHKPKKTKGRRTYLRMTRTAQVDSSPLSSTTHPLLLTEMSSAPAVVTNQGIGPQRTDTEPPCYKGNKCRTRPFGFPTGLGPDGPREIHAVTF